MLGLSMQNAEHCTKKFNANVMIKKINYLSNLSLSRYAYDYWRKDSAQGRIAHWCCGAASPQIIFSQKK